MSTYPTEKIPEFFVESKHADIEAFRGDDFHYAWRIGDNQLLSVEYIPENWPCLTVCLNSGSVSKMIRTLKSIGFKVNKQPKS